MIDPATAAGALVKAKEALGSASPEAEEFAAQVTGSGRQELGGWFADHIRLRRFKSQLRIMEKAKKYAEEAGANPKVVKLNLLVPLLEAGGLEESDEMADRWAALLATASVSDPDEVPPSFVEVLRQLAPAEARVLQEVCELLIEHVPRDEWESAGVKIDAIKRVFDMDDREVAVCVENLYRLGICAPGAIKTARSGIYKYRLAGSRTVCLTEFGYAFVQACQPPGEPLPEPQVESGGEPSEGD